MKWMKTHVSLARLFDTDFESGILMAVGRRAAWHLVDMSIIAKCKHFEGLASKRVHFIFATFNFLIREGPFGCPTVITRGLLEKCLIVFKFAGL